ncbi:multidrug effflux MFS transporter [Tropicimonas sp. S265A]|uniref:multidrug effflux MFS transporter n=1 Tax=Tropicimonas sp. S265A TaxID=3415134 RepID=UPI003C799E5A
MPRTRLSPPEFIALIAALFSTIAFSIDAMLPAMPEIALALTPEAPNRAALIITSFVLGMGIGTLFAGPLSDALGRRPVILGGAVLYCAGAALAWAAPSLELALAGRVIQGLGGAGPRVVAVAIVRDLYAGRQMARIMSFVFLVFSLIPAIAPSIGAGIMALTGWRGIFGAFITFSVLSAFWLWLRQPETLPPAARRPFQARSLLSSVREVLENRVLRLTIVVQTLAMGCLFSILSSTQQTFDQTFGRGNEFPLWFALIAIIAALSSLVNARVVVRLGMRKMVRGALVFQIVSVLAFLAISQLALPQPVYFAAYVAWNTSVFFMVGLTIGNLNAIALEPMGHIAGTAASVVGAIATVGSVLLAVPLGLQFDGTPVPIALGICVLAVIGYGVMRVLGSRDEVPA